MNSNLFVFLLATGTTFLGMWGQSRVSAYRAKAEEDVKDKRITARLAQRRVAAFRRISLGTIFLGLGLLVVPFMSLG